MGWKKISLTGLLLLVTAGMARSGLAAVSNDPLLDRLKDSRHTLLEGIAQAQGQSGFAVSAKFELEGTNLNLSVYTADQGKDLDAEHNVLKEVAGEATSAQWQPTSEVFEDKPHIARATTHLTLMQLSKLTLKDVIEKASYSQEGVVYSVTPKILNGEPVCEVLIASPAGQSVPVIIPLQ